MALYQPPDPYNVTATVAAIAANIASTYGVDSTRLVNIALATMQQESGGNPQAVGDNGTSFGLFQLNEGGELGKLTRQQAFDPNINARTAITVIAQTLKANPQMSDGQIAAAAQRPADQSGYAASVNAILGGGGTGGTIGSAAQPAGAANSDLPPVDVAQDPAKLDQWIRQNQSSYGWLLDVDPKVKQLVEQQISAGNTANLMAMVEQTTWWKTTSSALRQYYENMAADPGDYSFTVAGSTASQTLANIMDDASGAGVTLTRQQAETIATDSMKWGWNPSQVKAAIGSMVTYGVGADGQVTTDAQTIVNHLDQVAGQYYQKPSPQVLQSWAQNIAAGTQTIDQYTAYMAKNAALQWTGMAGQIQQGYTPQQITDSLRTQLASTLAVDPTSIDFVNDPGFSKILDYVPPGSTDPTHRMMTQSEALQYVKSTPSFGYQNTQGARDAAAQLETTLSQAWGKVGQ